MLGIAYAASMAGIGSKIGTGTNLVFVKEARRTLGLEISFLDWFKVGLPIVCLAIPLAWLYLVRVVAPLPATSAPEGEAAIAEERSRLGPMSAGELVALVAFLLAASLWVLRQPMDFGLLVIPGWSDHLPFGWPELLGRPVESLPPPFAELLGPRGAESVVALLVGGALFFIPVSGRPPRAALPVKAGMSIAWGMLILLGGGFAMADGISQSGLSGIIATALTGWTFPTPLLGFIAVCLLTIALSEVASNTATASILLPLLAVSAPGLGLPAAPVMFAAALAASFGFMLPAGTPPNAVVFASGYLTVRQMARAGLVVDLFGGLLIAFAASVLVPWALGR
jgi:sodium-dependent dicarboxylate transporter 2/3/5